MSTFQIFHLSVHFHINRGQIYLECLFQYSKVGMLLITELISRLKLIHITVCVCIQNITKEIVIKVTANAKVLCFSYTLSYILSPFLIQNALD